MTTRLLLLFALVTGCARAEASDAEQWRLTATGATAPEPEESAGSADGSSASFTVTLPNGIESGELLMIFMAHDDAGGDSAITQSSGPTFTKVQEAQHSTKAVRGIIWARLADGTETDPVFASDNSQDVISVAARFAEHAVTDVATEIYKRATPVEATSQNVNCGSVTPAPGSANYLFLAVAVADNDDGSSGTYQPGNYTGILQAESGAGAGTALVAVAKRELTGTSDNPADVVFLGGNQENIGFTLAFIRTL